MKKFILLLSITAVLVIAVWSSFLAPVIAADPKEVVGGGANTVVQPSPGGPTVESTVQKVINIVSFFVGAIAVIMIIYAAYTFMIAGGDATKVKKARTIFIYALIGLAVVALSQVIVTVVFTKVVNA